jgi:hypothetical protein
LPCSLFGHEFFALRELPQDRVGKTGNGFAALGANGVDCRIYCGKCRDSIERQELIRRHEQLGAHRQIFETARRERREPSLERHANSQRAVQELRRERAVTLVERFGALEFSGQRGRGERAVAQHAQHGLHRDAARASHGRPASFVRVAQVRLAVPWRLARSRPNASRDHS